MKNSGVTLIELLVVITIATILIVVLGFEFTGWQGKYRVESQVKGIFDDLQEARMRAMMRNRVHFVSLLTTTSYTVHDDDSDGTAKVPDGDGVLQLQAGVPDVTQDTRLGSFPKTVEFDIRWNYANLGAQQDISFNTRGLAAPNGNISFFVDRDGDGVKDFVPDYDCIIIFSTRINMGQLNAAGDTCDAK